MRVVENYQEGSALLRRVRESRPERVGIHVSDLIFCIRKAWAKRVLGNLAAEEDEATLVFLLGEGYHKLLEAAGERGTHEWRTQRNGIWATVDFAKETETGIVPVEFKTTRASSNKDIILSPHYFEQLAAYAFLLDSELGQLVVVHINGDYKPPKPKVRVYDAHWDRDELRGWWGELLRRKAVLEDHLARSQGTIHYPPDVAQRYGWECGYCPFRDILGCGTRDRDRGSYDGGYLGVINPAWERMDLSI